MTISRAVIATVLLVVVSVSMLFAQEISITIDKIITNERIAGRISGLSTADYPNYKVIVYVHTDRWYIHPYAGQGEGMSWASIQENGTWQIQTVQREFKAVRVAALLVQQNYPEPSVVENLEQIQSRARVIRELWNTPDYNKL